MPQLFKVKATYDADNVAPTVEDHDSKSNIQIQTCTPSTVAGAEVDPEYTANFGTSNDAAVQRITKVTVNDGTVGKGALLRNPKASLRKK